MDVRENISSGKRLIDADALRQEIERIYLKHFAKSREKFVQDTFKAMFKRIDNAKTVDYVEVVRCRECKQGEVDDPDFPDQYYCHAGCGWNNGDFYCAYGEREEGADNG